MKQIITIQHTQSIHHTNGMVGSWTDWDLSELGIEQAERIGQKLAKQLSGHKIVMYASDLLRAKHTAEIVAKHMGITPNIRTELRERNLGKCVGKSVQWLRENIEVQEKTITGTVTIATRGIHPSNITNVRFVGDGTGIGLSASEGAFLHRCTFENWEIGAYGGLGSWVNATGCTFRGNDVGL